MKRNPLVIIEMNDRHCKVLRAKPVADGYHVASMTTARISDPSQEALVKLLSSQITSADKKAQCVVVLSRQQVILKNLSLPSQAKEELGKMIALQVSTQVPYAREDIVFDHLVLGQDAAGYTKVLVAIVHKEAIEEWIKIFKSAGLMVSQLVLSSASIVSWANAKLTADLEPATSVSGLLSLEAGTSELCLVKNQQLVYSREIKHGLRDIGGDFEDAFLKDISLTLESFTREHPQDEIKKLFVLSAPISSPLFDKIKAQGQIDVRFMDPCAFLKNTESILLPQNKGDDYASAVVCLGAIQEAQKITLNLLPEKVRRDQQGQARRRQWILFGLLLIVNVVLGGALVLQRSYSDEAYLTALRQRTAVMRSRAEEVKRQEDQIKQIEQSAIPMTSVVDVVDGLYAMTPKEVSFQLLFLDRNDRLTIQGIAETRASVNDFHRNLIGSPLFQDVNLEYAAQRRFFEGEITDFKITASVKRGKEQP